jgi:hypothetical protein
MPDPPVFQNDGNPMLEDWYIERVKLRSESTWDEEDKAGHELLRAGKSMRALIQTSYFEDEYSTSQEMLQVLQTPTTTRIRKRRFVPCTAVSAWETESTLTPSC